MTNQTVRWGVVSTAAINDLVLPAFAECDRAELVAVASRDSARAMEYAAAREIPHSYGSYEELLADDAVDCVYISLPNSLHGEWTRKALEAGRHVLCEKPLTPSVSEARGLFALAESQGLQLMEAFMYRHHPQTQTARRLVGEGRIGEPQVVRSWFHFAVEEPSNDVRYSRELAGGALRDVGCYCVSMSTYLLDAEPDEVAGLAVMTAGGVDERFAGSMSFSRGALATFDCGIQGPLDIGVTVVGSEGTLHVPTPWYPHQPPMKLVLTGRAGVEEVPAPGPNAYLLEVENFTAAILGEETPLIAPAETIRTLTTIDRLAESAELS